MSAEAIARYLQGTEFLRKSVDGMSREQLLAQPIPGTWSTMQVLCHLADFEPIYADRMKRIIAEENPLILSGDPDLFARHLSYDQRDPQDELDLVDAVRRQLGRILSSHPESIFQRTGRHSEDGEISLETLLTRITNHIPHHVKFIEEKRAALGLPAIEP
ncbi:MAG TPA: DinB family protein [Planctomicrobium sp.]|nr:DinB family protein [Planctomicrobium sp.]